jgi:hypothetical protein
MRHLNLAAAVLLGVGMFTTHSSAQQQPPLAADTHADATMRETLRRRALASLEAAMKGNAADFKRFQLNGEPGRLEFKGDVPNLFPPVDCGMPVMTGDPAIDPQFSKQPPSPPGKSFWSMKVIPVKPCPR